MPFAQAAVGSNLAAARIKLEQWEGALAATKGALLLPAAATVRAKLHYRRAIALRALGQPGERDALASSARCHFMPAVAEAALQADARGPLESQPALSRVLCVRKLTDAFFNRIARVGNTWAEAACCSPHGAATVERALAKAREATAVGSSCGAGSGSPLPHLEGLFAGVGDVRNLLSTAAELHCAAGVFEAKAGGDTPGVADLLRGPTFGLRVALHMNDVCIATLARNVVILAIAAGGPAPEAPPAEQLNWTFYLVCVWSARALCTTHAKSLRRQLRELAAPTTPAEFHRAFGYFVRLGGEESRTLAKLREVWHVWLAEARSATLTEEEERVVQSSQMSRHMQRARNDMMGVGMHADVDERERIFYEEHGWLPPMATTARTLRSTAAGLSAMRALDRAASRHDYSKLAINPTLCDHEGSGTFVDVQGPFKAFRHDDPASLGSCEFMHEEAWGLTTLTTSIEVVCPDDAEPGDRLRTMLEDDGEAGDEVEVGFEIPHGVAPGEDFRADVRVNDSYLDVLLLRMTHLRRVFRATTTAAATMSRAVPEPEPEPEPKPNPESRGMRVLVHVVPGDAFEAAHKMSSRGLKPQRFDFMNLSNIADYSGVFACLLAFVPLLRDESSVLQVTLAQCCSMPLCARRAHV